MSEPTKRDLQDNKQLWEAGYAKAEKDSKGSCVTCHCPCNGRRGWEIQGIRQCRNCASSAIQNKTIDKLLHIATNAKRGAK